jgi:hypothetical protein
LFITAIIKRTEFDSNLFLSKYRHQDKLPEVIVDDENV